MVELIKSFFKFVFKFAVILIIIAIVGAIAGLIFENHSEKNSYIRVKPTVKYLIEQDGKMRSAQNKKDYSKEEPCYAEVITNINKGSTFAQDTIMVTYRFTKKGNIGINVSESSGSISEKITGNDNVVEFYKTISLLSKSLEDDVIFRYEPTESAENVKVEVLFASPVSQSSNISSTIYFK